MLIGGALALLVLAIWSDALVSLLPGMGRGSAPPAYFVLPLLALVALIAIAGWCAYGEAYLATIVLTATVMPAGLAALILLVFLATGPSSVLHKEALYLGGGGALLIWVGAAPLFRWLVTVDTAQSRSYGELLFRTKAARRRLEAMCSQTGAAPSPDCEPSPCTGACDEAHACLTALEAELGISNGEPAAGFRYGFATGYVNLWRTLYKIDELLLMVAPASFVVGSAVWDRLRLADSKVPNAPVLLRILDVAIRPFGPMALPAGPEIPASEFVAGSSDVRAAARAALREVQQAINAYRNDLWEGLIRTRNRLLRTILLTSSATLVFVGLAVLFINDQKTVAAAVTFYLIGAVVGLFALLRSEGRGGPRVDDYGVFEARLLSTPLLSGVAAIGGVFILAAAPAILGTGDASSATIDLGKMFAVDNTRSLLAAAAFGLAPELLVRWLGNQADTLKKELTSSQPSGGSAVPNAMAGDG
jgi:hypothetical protein